MGNGHLWESIDMGSLLRRGLDTSSFWKRIYCMQFLRYNMCGSMLTVKVLCIGVCSTYRKQRDQPKGGISYIPWCIASYYIIKLPNARDAISSTGTRQLNSSGKRLVLPIRLSVPLQCRSIYDFRFTIPNISLVKAKRVFRAPITS